MPSEHIVHVIKKVRIIVYPMIHRHVVVLDDVGNPKTINYYATIYDEGTHLKSVYEENEGATLRKAVAWVHGNFTVPDSIAITSRQPQDHFTQYTDEHGRVHSGYRDQEEE